MADGRSVTMSTKVGADVAAMIDAARGPVTRSTWLARAAEAFLPGNPVGQAKIMEMAEHESKGPPPVVAKDVDARTPRRKPIEDVPAEVACDHPLGRRIGKSCGLCGRQVGK